MYFLLKYKTVENYVERRAPFRPDHLAYSNSACGRGELIMGGALGDPPRAALLIFKAADRSVVEEFARNDPYVRAGLIVEWTVEPWTVVIGG